MHHLRKHHTGTYHFRLTVPVRHRPALGQREIVKSLQTKDPTEARVRAYLLSAKLLTTFRELEQTVPKNGDFPRIIPFGIKIGSVKIDVDSRIPGDAEAAREFIYKTPELKAALKRQIAEATIDRYQATEPEHLARLTVKPLNVAVVEYLMHHEKLKTKSVDQIKGALSHFVDWIGVSYPHFLNDFRCIEKKHLIAYREVLGAIKNSRSKNKDEPISASRQMTRLGFIQTFFLWAGDEALFPAGEHYLPTHRLVKKIKNASYEEFNPAELARIYEPQRYLGFNRLPHQYWIPLLGLFTGARLSELCYLRPVDFQLHPDGVWIIDFNHSATKNPSSKRVVPMHSKLRDMGLLDYLKAVTAVFGSEAEIFAYSGAPDKAAGGRFAAYLDEAKVISPLKVFHSYRKNVAKAMQNSGVDTRYGEYLSGHLSPALHFVIYADHPKPLVRFTEYVERMRFPVDLTPLILKGEGWEDPVAAWTKILTHEKAKGMRRTIS